MTTGATVTGLGWRDLLPESVDDGAAEASRLALGVELRQRHTRTRTSWAPARAETATARSLELEDVQPLVGVRPMVRSRSTGDWIKGEVSWEVLRRYGHRYPARQVRWFLELFSIAHDSRSTGIFPDGSEWVTVDVVPSRLLWADLRSHEHEGIPLVPTVRAQRVHLAEVAHADLLIERQGGGFRVRPRVCIDGSEVDASCARPMGTTGLYHWAGTAEGLALTLAGGGVEEPVAALLRQGSAIRIDPDEREEFLARGLPSLRRVATVTAAAGTVLPDPMPARLELAAHFHPRDVLEYTFRWRHPDGAYDTFDSPAGAGRDASAEAAVRVRVHDLWSGSGTDAPFMAAGRLEGIEAAAFAAHVLPVMEDAEDVDVAVTGRRRAYRELVGRPEITVTTVPSADPDWFDLGVVVTIEGRRIPFRALFTALSMRRRRMLLADGEYFSLAHPALDRLRELVDEAGAVPEWESGPRLSRAQVSLWEDFEDLADQSVPARQWRELVRGLTDGDGVRAVPVPEQVRVSLRGYQRAGVDWLAFLWHHRLGGILADDMGLGKTLQVLTLIAHMHALGERRPILVVAPTSVMGTWRDEAARAVPDLAVRVVGSARSGIPRPQPGEVVVTSYTLLRLRAGQFAETSWAAVVLDEAQFVKNPATKSHQAVADLHADAVYAITGTPMENGLGELWALLALTAPGLFPSQRRFRQEYIGPIEKGKVPENQEGSEYREQRLARLRRRVRPLLLRRTKQMVAAELPERQEQVLSVELGPAHRSLYDTVLQRERQKVLGLLDDLDRNRFIVFRSLTLLRMLSLSPSLVDAAHSSMGSAKLDVLTERIGRLAAEGHRCLVFSQFTSFLRQARKRLSADGITSLYLDGSTRRRDEVIDHFRSGTAPALLISLKAGGFGLTLTEADYVFLLDPWWNPAAEAQAVDRVHRIGQERAVFVYRMIATGTIEEKVLALQQRKARLFHAVMDAGALFSKSLDAEEIAALLEA